MRFSVYKLAKPDTIYLLLGYINTKLPMLKAEAIDRFIADLPTGVQGLVRIITKKETWPMDDTDEVSMAINALSSILEEDPNILVFANNKSALSSMALMQLPRALVLLSYILKTNPKFISDVIAEPGLSGTEVQHKVIMVNRLMFMARTKLIREIFDERNCELIKNQLSENFK